MYNTLIFLDYTAELIELAYDLGSATRKYLVPVVVALYVATTMVYQKLRTTVPKSRRRLVQDCLRCYEEILKKDPQSTHEEALEALWYFDSLTYAELMVEWEAIK